MGALRNVKHERFALLVACCVSHQQAAKDAGIDTVYPGNVARIARRKDVRRRIDELSADGEAVVREKRARVEARLNVAAYGKMLDFAIIDPETKQIIAYDWAAIKESDLAVTVESLSFDKDTGRVVKFERDNAMNATAQLRDMLGFKAVTKVASTNPQGDGPAVQVIEIVRFAEDQAPA
jgi:hypothetical protein